MFSRLRNSYYKVIEYSRVFVQKKTQNALISSNWIRKRVYLPLYKVANTPSYIQRDDIMSHKALLFYSKYSLKIRNVWLTLTTLKYSCISHEFFKFEFIIHFRFIYTSALVLRSLEIFYFFQCGKSYLYVRI